MYDGLYGSRSFGQLALSNFLRTDLVLAHASQHVAVAATYCTVIIALSYSLH